MMVLSRSSSPALTAANPTNPVQNAPQRRTRKTLRIRVACLRCQRRKIRVLSLLPSNLATSPLIRADLGVISATEPSLHVGLAQR